MVRHSANTYQQVAEQDHNRHLSNSRDVDACLFFDVCCEILLFNSSASAMLAIKQLSNIPSLLRNLYTQHRPSKI